MTTGVQDCENCRYFIKHYAKYPVDILNYLGCGHCVHPSKVRRAPKNRQVFNNRPACEFWEPQKIQDDIRKDSIKKAIRKMQKKLNDIALILSDD
ncbi:MAG: hypothetical protein K2I30_00165 [Clostridia bacterium]|nr:hypothetical protein [Clostridia bacterium]